MEQDLARRSFQAVIWNYIGAGGKVIAQLVIQIWLARMLGPEVFGQYTAVLVVIGFGWLFADSGMGSALVQKEQITDDDVGYALGWVLLLSMISGILVMVLSPYIAVALGEPKLAIPLMVCGPIIVLQAMSNLGVSLMQRDLDMKKCQMIQLSAYAIGFGLIALVLAYLGAGVWSLVIGFLFQTLIVLVFSYAAVQHTLRPRLRGDAGLRSFGLGVLGTNLANWGIENLDRFLVGRQWGIAALGAYAAASNLSRVPTSLLVSSVQSVAFSSASRVQADHDRIRRGYISIVSLTALITFPLSAALSLKAEFVIHLLYGDRWNDAVPLFSTFCIAVPLYVLLSITGPTLWAIGAVAREFKIQLFCAVALFVGLVLLAGHPLVVAIWLIPCIYFMRFALVYLVLARRIELSHMSTFRSLTGGLILAVLVTVTELASRHLVSGPLAGQLWWDFIQILTQAAICLGAVRLFPTFMIEFELRRMLLSRSSDSKLARILCHLVALKEQ
jgi:PST family polysaccharide transporter